eukprot:6213986-Pleurochrysis_carterae.AAC.2
MGGDAPAALPSPPPGPSPPPSPLPRPGPGGPGGPRLDSALPGLLDDVRVGPAQLRGRCAQCCAVELPGAREDRVACRPCNGYAPLW